VRRHTNNKTSGQNNLTKRPHRRRTWTVQSYSPSGANVHPDQLHASLDHSSPHPKRHLDRHSRFCTAHGRVAVYFTMGRPFPFIIALGIADLDTRLTHDSLGPLESTTQTAYRSVQQFLQGSRSRVVTDRQTDRPRYIICNNRLHQHWVSDKMSLLCLAITLTHTHELSLIILA